MYCVQTASHAAAARTSARSRAKGAIMAGHSRHRASIVYTCIYVYVFARVREAPRRRYYSRRRRADGADKTRVRTGGMISKWGYPSSGGFFFFRPSYPNDECAYMCVTATDAYNKNSPIYSRPSSKRPYTCVSDPRYSGDDGRVCVPFSRAVFIFRSNWARDKGLSRFDASSPVPRRSQRFSTVRQDRSADRLERRRPRRVSSCRYTCTRSIRVPIAYERERRHEIGTRTVGFSPIAKAQTKMNSSPANRRQNTKIMYLSSSVHTHTHTHVTHCWSDFVTQRSVNVGARM